MVNKHQLIFRDIKKFECKDIQKIFWQGEHLIQITLLFFYIHQYIYK